MSYPHAMKALDVPINPDRFHCGDNEVFKHFDSFYLRDKEKLIEDINQIGFEQLCFTGALPIWDKEDRRTTGNWYLMILDKNGVAYGVGWNKE